MKPIIPYAVLLEILRYYEFGDDQGLEHHGHGLMLPIGWKSELFGPTWAYAKDVIAMRKKIKRESARTKINVSIKQLLILGGCLVAVALVIFNAIITFKDS